MAEKDLDVVVFGATGVTGRRVSKYLAERGAETGASWAAAARDADKLRRVMDEDGVEGAETIAADLGDPGSLEAMASRAKSVLNLVGPYTLYGRPVMDACIAAGANYLDLAGEIPFSRRVNEALDGPAKDAGIKLVQVCGFEALPPDMMVLLAAEAATERWDEGLAQADVEVSTTPPKGLPHPSDLLSGGTLQTVAVTTGDEDARVMTDPAALIDDPSMVELVRARSPIELAPRRGDGGAVIAPMSPTPFINPAVIHRTAALRAAQMEKPFQPFRYREGVAIRGPGVTLPLRYAAAGALSGMQVGISAAAKARPGIRSRVGDAMSSILPGSGFGPVGDRVEGWRWSMRLDALTTSGNGIRVDLEADGQPGYLTTARMLGEAGLMLAEKGVTPDVSGCLTPAIAIGTGAIDRFERARMRFSVST
jgi:short subunit dehydrogenase-like uncharacterized protein